MKKFSKLYENNDGSRTLYESIVADELILALREFKLNYPKEFVLIGGLALSYHCKPRTTMDIDIIFLSEDDIIDNVNRFKKIRNHCFQHNTTHVEIETLTPEFLKLDKSIVSLIMKTSIIDKDSGIRIASPTGILVSKLFRFSRQDQADIENLKNGYDIDLTPFIPYLEQEQIDKYNSI